MENLSIEQQLNKLMNQNSLPIYVLGIDIHLKSNAEFIFCEERGNKKLEYLVRDNIVYIIKAENKN